MSVAAREESGSAAIISGQLCRLSQRKSESGWLENPCTNTSTRELPRSFRYPPSGPMRTEADWAGLVPAAWAHMAGCPKGAKPRILSMTMMKAARDARRAMGNGVAGISDCSCPYGTGTSDRGRFKVMIALSEGYGNYLRPPPTKVADAREKRAGRRGFCRSVPIPQR